jgi:hypothetical protein
MSFSTSRAVSIGAVLAIAASLATAQERGPRGGPPRPEGPVAGSGQSAAERDLIQWFGTWEGAQAEAERTGKPILLLAAAPQCHGISGVW